MALQEDFADAFDIAKVKLEIENGAGEMIPFEMLQRITAGESSVKVWREFRKMSIADLTTATGVSASTISKIENNKQQLGTAKAVVFAMALGVDTDDLLDI